MAIYRKELSNDSRYYITFTLEETDEGQTRTLTYELTATKTSGTGYYNELETSPLKITIDNIDAVDTNISYDFRNSTPKTITLASGTLISTQHTFSSLTIPIEVYFSSYPNNLGDATITATFNLNVLHNPPYNITYRITELNNDLTDAGISNNVFVKNLSNKEIGILSTSYNDGALGSSSKLINGTNEFNNYTGTISVIFADFSTTSLQTVEDNGILKAPIRVSVTDTQGATGYDSASSVLYDVINYEKVSIFDAFSRFTRVGQTSGQAYITLTGNYFSGEIGNVDQSTSYKPTIKYKFWKLGDTEPSTYDYTIPSENITIDANAGEFLVTRYNIGSTTETDVNYFDPDYAWRVKFYVSDNFSEVESGEERGIAKGYHLWAEFKDRVDFQKITISNTPLISSSTNYIKQYDGTLICWGTYNTGAITWSQDGNVWLSNEFNFSNFPVSFVSTPTVTKTVQDVSPSSRALWINGVGSPTTTNAGSFRLSTYWNASSTSATISYIAIGRWK